MVIVLIVIVLGLAAGGVWWLMTDRDTTEQTSNPSSSQQSDGDDEGVNAASVITYTNTGFRASEDTVAAGSTVLVINESSETLEFSSDPHPQHHDNPELNMPALRPGERGTIVVQAPGRWGFHNHLNDDHSGFLTVTD